MGASKTRRARRAGLVLPTSQTVARQQPTELIRTLDPLVRGLGQAGLTFGGARDMYEICGFKRPGELNLQDFRLRYDRGGIAKRIIDCFPTSTWSGLGSIYEDEDPEHETAFETAANDLLKRLKVWSRFKRADRLARLAEFSCLFIGGALNDLTTELPRNGRIDYLSPFHQESVTITKWDEDIKSPRCGLPLEYSLRRQTFGLTQAPAASTVPQTRVHWSRIIHIPAEDPLDSEISGPAIFMAVWNDLDSYDKIISGGAEAFAQRANQGLILSIDKDLKAMDPAERDNFAKQVDEFQNNIGNRALRVRGMEAKMLGSDVANLADPSDALLTAIAATLGIPKRILLGAERGQLASSQDEKNYTDRIADRRTSYAEPDMVNQLVDRLIAYGYLPKPKEYFTDWPISDDMLPADRAAGLNAWVNANKVAGEEVFSWDECREVWYGLKARTEVRPLVNAPKPQLPGGRRAGDPNADPTADPTVDPTVATVQ